MILQLKNIKGGYRKNSDILKGIDLEISERETIAVIGQNGAGKSTLAKAIINFLPYRKGAIFFQGKNITGYSTRRLNETGIVYFMQGGRVFPGLSVKENMLFAALNQKNPDFDYSLFPDLQKHWLDDAGLLSGGERHHLALAMALIKKPKLLILDEPSAGLSPVATLKLYEILNQVITSYSLSILLIEQNVKNAVDFSDRVAVLQQGKISRLLSTGDSQETMKKIQEIFF